MNIFTTSYSPRKAARALDDSRLGKMILETAQMLCTVINLEAGKQITPYKNSHATNPLVKWAAESKRNYWWLWNLGVELSIEYSYRNSKSHASTAVIHGLEVHRPFEKTKLPKRWHNSAAHKKLGLDFKHLPIKQAYRLYLRERWRLQEAAGRAPTWKNRGEPEWR